MLSEGGFTSPDIWIVIAVILTATISVILNPLVFRHNLHKKRSIARDLYMALAATDFLSSVAMSINLTLGITASKEEQCFIDHNATFCQTNYYRYYRTATVTEKAVGGVVWSLAFIPLIITAVLAVSRWYQISHPLRPLSRNAIKIILVLCCLLLVGSFHRYLFIEPTKNPIVFKMNIQAFAYLRKSGVLENLTEILAVLISFISSLASAITVWNIFKSPAVPGNEQIRSRRIKSSLKIALLNIGNLSCGGAVIPKLFTVYESDEYYIFQTTVCLLPLFLSTSIPTLLFICS